jgi:ribosomal-protein-alanine N-acetyltransferase
VDPIAPGSPDFAIRSMSDESAEQIAKWQYPPPYDFYDAVEEDLPSLLDATLRAGRFFEVADARGTLIGFYEFKTEFDPLEIGLGLSPHHVGHGRGLAFVQAGIEFAQKEFGAKRICLNVAAFNQRAITVYERAGFRQTRSYQHRIGERDYHFLEMVLDPM